MSKEIDVMSEELFNQFIIQFDTLQREPLDNPMVLLEKYSEEYTIPEEFSQLYDIILQGEKITNNFSEEFDLQIFKVSKEKIIDMINKSKNPDVIEEWNSIMESLEYFEPTENLYFIID